MASALHLPLTLLLASLTTARLQILATPDPLIKHITNTNPPDWLSPQACHPRSNFPSAPPVNATDLREDAKRFCARAAELVPVMRPKQVVRGNGLGVYSEQHFQLEFLHPCPHSDVKAQDPQDPMGDGILVKGQSWCVALLAGNWDRCRTRRQAGVGGGEDCWVRAVHDGAGARGPVIVNTKMDSLGRAQGQSGMGPLLCA